MTRRKDPLPEAAEIKLHEPAAGSDAEPSLVAAPLTSEAPVTEPRSDINSAPSASAPPRRPGVAGPLLGGALAALGGFAVSHFYVFDLAASDQSAEVADLTKRLDAALSGQALAQDEAGEKIAEITKRVAKLEATPVPEAPDLSRLDDLDRRLAMIEALPAEGGASTTALTAKLAELERQLAALPTSSASPGLQAELDAALVRLNAAEAAAASRAAEAETAANAAARDLALDALADAIGTGRPFAAELQALKDPALMESLGPFAAAGVPSLEQLTTDFPEAARNALRAAREISTEDGWTDRLTDFLASQTGARALTPIQGDGPDAVLSRAEFALSEGRVADAIAELAPLDPAVTVALETWITDAKAHLAAAAAISAARGT
jgi:hypothetical protein